MLDLCELHVGWIPPQIWFWCETGEAKHILKGNEKDYCSYDKSFGKSRTSFQTGPKITWEGSNGSGGAGLIIPAFLCVPKLSWFKIPTSHKDFLPSLLTFEAEGWRHGGTCWYSPQLNVKIESDSSWNSLGVNASKLHYVHHSQPMKEKIVKAASEQCDMLHTRK